MEGLPEPSEGVRFFSFRRSTSSGTQIGQSGADQGLSQTTQVGNGPDRRDRRLGSKSKG